MPKFFDISKYYENRAKYLKIAGLDAIDTIQKRVINDGKNADGQIFGNYTEATKKKKKKTRSVLTPYVNFVDTGKMMKSFAANLQDNVVSVVASGSRNAEILGYQDNRTEKGVYSGYIRDLSDKEWDDISKDLAFGILNNL